MKRKIILSCTIIPNPENKEQVNHKHLDKTNNLLDNLEWMTNAENAQHAYDNGRTRLSGDLQWRNW